jgi:hypothetical protein
MIATREEQIPERGGNDGPTAPMTVSPSLKTKIERNSPLPAGLLQFRLILQ